MTIKLRNRWKYLGKEDWEWDVFLDDAGTGDLESVAYVEYVLHPDFPHPLETVKNPRGGFVLESRGWGTFTIKAFVHMKDGKKKKLTHELDLFYDPSEGESK